VELQFREYYLIAYIYWIKAAGILTTKIYWKSSLLKTTSPPPSGDARHNILYSAKPKNLPGTLSMETQSPFTICPDSLLKEG
jgi:hypothetical protein